MIDILRIAVPITVWLASFSALYGLHGLICSGQWGPESAGPSGRSVLIIAWGLAIAIQVLLLVALLSGRMASPSPLVRQVSLILAATALFATVWTLLPVASASHCV